MTPHHMARHHTTWHDTSHHTTPHHTTPHGTPHDKPHPSLTASERVMSLRRASQESLRSTLLKRDITSPSMVAMYKVVFVSPPSVQCMEGCIRNIIISSRSSNIRSGSSYSSISISSSSNRNSSSSSISISSSNDSSTSISISTDLCRLEACRHRKWPCHGRQGGWLVAWT